MLLFWPFSLNVMNSRAGILTVAVSKQVSTLTLDIPRIKEFTHCVRGHDEKGPHPEMLASAYHWGGGGGCKFKNRNL
jgi:hypothetical protein